MTVMRNVIPGLCIASLLATFSLGGVNKSSASSQDLNLIVETGHSDVIESVALSADSTLAATGSRDKTVKVWQVATGRQIVTLRERQAVDWVRFVGDSRVLASAAGNSVTLWNVADGQRIRTIDLTHPAKQAVVSPYSTLLAVSQSGSVEILNTANGLIEKKFTCEDDTCRPVQFLGDGNSLVIANGNKIAVWNTETGSIHATDARIDGTEQLLRLSADGRVFLRKSGSSIQLLETSSGRVLREIEARDIATVSVSPDGDSLATGGYYGEVGLIPESGVAQALQPRAQSADTGELRWITSLDFSRDSKLLASVGADRSISFWDLKRGALASRIVSDAFPVTSFSFSRDGKSLAVSDRSRSIRIWDFENGASKFSLREPESWVNSVAFSPDSGRLVSATTLNALNIWSTTTRQIERSLTATWMWGQFASTAFSNDGEHIAAAFWRMPGRNEVELSTTYIWNAKTGALLHTLADGSAPVYSTAFSPDGSILATGGEKEVVLWQVRTGALIKSLSADSPVRSISFSRDGRLLAIGSARGLSILDLATYREIEIGSGAELDVLSVAFLGDSKSVVAGTASGSIKLWAVGSRQLLASSESHSSEVVSVQHSPDGSFVVTGSSDGTLRLHRPRDLAPVATLVALGGDEWLVTTPDGRFDTNTDLDRIEGLHWILDRDLLNPLEIEIFMRQYYEPALLSRLLKCERENNCASEFKPIPSIAEINRVQPKVGTPRVMNTSSSGFVDIAVDIENATNVQSVNGHDTRLRSGVYDLRLFLDGQLVATSVSTDDAQRYISGSGDASTGVENDAAIWRDTHDIGKKVDLENGRATYTFRGIRLPRDGRKQVEISAYAFNADRVKSETMRTTVKLPAVKVVKGKTILLTIGVNASESPKYALSFAANDARKMQQVLGGRLLASGHDLVRINLVSDYGPGNRLAQNLATKKIIKGVFDILAGRRSDVDARTLKTIDRLGRLDTVRPEDTVIISFSGHGYTRRGVFYMLPYDIGEHTAGITREVLPRLISSDELSLWMREILAKEIIFVVDACHSAASIQGPDFKPGPMGSRGLGQLAYDKGMRVLAATQTNNVALELRSLKHGLLSYALLEDGIVRGLADTELPTDGMLSAGEWLGYATKGVPALYKKLIDGKSRLAISGNLVDFSKLNEKEKAETFCQGNNCRSKASVQQPVLFDFARPRRSAPMFGLARKR